MPTYRLPSLPSSGKGALLFFREILFLLTPNPSVPVERSPREAGVYDRPSRTEH